MALQLSNLPFLMRRTTLFFFFFLNLSSRALLSVHGLSWFLVPSLREGWGGVCVQATLAQCATRMPGTTERREKERERPTSPPKTLCLLTMQVSG